jgi:hypothetical protein
VYVVLRELDAGAARVSLSERAEQHVLGFDDTSVPEREPVLTFLLTEEDARALMIGTVPETVRDQARAAVFWEWDCGTDPPTKLFGAPDRPLIRHPRKTGA